VTFTAPATGPGGAFFGSATATSTADASGVAVAPVLTANSIAGVYSVVASSGGVNVRFALTNIPAPALPQITANVELLQFRFDAARAPSEPEIIDLNSNTGAPVALSVSSSAPWLKFSLSRPITPAQLKVWIEPAGLAPGSYSATLTLGAGWTVMVTMTVLPPPVVTASTPAVSFQATPGGPNPPRQIVYVSAGPREVKFTWTIRTASGDNWLKVKVVNDSDRLAANLLIEADAQGLEPGSYQGVIEIVAPGTTNSPFTVPVTLSVGARP
jgi:hypothetical protein